MINLITKVFSLVFISSCSLFGIQSTEQPKYTIMEKSNKFEIRKYDAYIVAKTTVTGDFKESQNIAFRILAGYIFGKNKGENKIPMTSPVQINQKSLKISMTSPVTMNKNKDSYTMSFMMPSTFTLESLPKPIDDNIIFEQVESKLIASYEFSWYSSQKTNDKKAKELKKWLTTQSMYSIEGQYFYAGYNPPWTIPFLRRNEVQFNLKEKL